jgi:hypothetical protein
MSNSLRIRMPRAPMMPPSPSTLSPIADRIRMATWRSCYAAVCETDQFAFKSTRIPKILVKSTLLKSIA